MIKDNYRRFRAVFVQTADRYFFEPGNLRRTHIQVYRLLIRPVTGIGPDTFRRDLHQRIVYPKYPKMPRHMELGVRAWTDILKYMSQGEAEEFLEFLCKTMEEAAKTHSPHFKCRNLLRRLRDELERMRL